jgi:hypothetical protein
MDSINQCDFNTTRENQETKKPGTGKQFDQLLPCAFLWKSISTSWRKSIGENIIGNMTYALACSGEKHPEELRR